MSNQLENTAEIQSIEDEHDHSSRKLSQGGLVVRTQKAANKTSPCDISVGTQGTVCYF